MLCSCRSRLHWLTAQGCETWESRAWIRYRPHTEVKQDFSSHVLIIVFSRCSPPFNHTVISSSCLSLRTHTMFYVFTALLILPCFLHVERSATSIFHPCIHPPLTVSPSSGFTSDKVLCWVWMLSFDNITFCSSFYVSLKGFSRFIPRSILPLPLPHKEWQEYSDKFLTPFTFESFPLVIVTKLTDL